jgi:predicted RNA binding protein YcfA (HicA-like mRNA interferase family)
MDGVLERIRRNPRNVRFDDLRRVCNRYFGKPRRRGSHLFYRMPWQGNPLVNIQPTRGMAKEYQVRQVLRAIDRLQEGQNG